MKYTRTRNLIAGILLSGIAAGCTSTTTLRLIPEGGCTACDAIDEPAQAETTADVPVTPLPSIVED